jgi:hypothetical protein
MLYIIAKQFGTISTRKALKTYWEKNEANVAAVRQRLTRIYE